MKSDIITPADSLLESVREEPMVKKFLETFRGDIAMVKPPKGDDNK